MGSMHKSYVRQSLPKLEVTQPAPHPTNQPEG